MAKKTQEYDITRLGPRRFNELREQNEAMQGNISDDYGFSDTRFVPSHTVTQHDPLQNRTQDVMSPLHDSKGKYWGKSRHDESFADSSDWERLGDIRAENQPGIEQILNGTIKMGTTAVTTFLDGTVGALYGLMQGVVNIGDNNPDTNFWRGLWDNDFNRAMASIQEAMEEIAPNYYTRKELESPWYSNIWSTNFLGDKILKNAGFTIGAMATMAVPGPSGVANLAGKGISGIGKLVAAHELVKTGGNLAKGLKVMRGFERAGGLTEKLLNSFISANGEAAIEAINAVRDNEKAIAGNIADREREAYENILEEYRMTGDEGKYRSDLMRLDSEVIEAKRIAESTMSSLGNSVYGMNVGLLMLTNNLEFGKYIKGGWTNNQGIKGMTRKVAGNIVDDDAVFGRGLATGTARLEVPEEIGKTSIGKIIGGTLARMGEEGFEEGSQRIISDSGQMQSQAKVNAWAGKRKDSLLGAEINPDVSEDLVDRLKAMQNAWNTGFGSIDAPGWEEVFLGALTGGLGTLSVHTHTDEATGKKKWDIWQGGFIEEIRKPKEEYARANKIVEAFNKYATSEDFRKRTAHAMASMTFSGQMDEAVSNNDIMAFKNAELMSVANDALYFREMGAIEAYKSFYEAMGQNVSEQDIAAVKAQMRGLEDGKSWFDTKTSDELKELLKDKAASTLEKINTVLDLHDAHTRLYKDGFDDLAPEYKDRFHIFSEGKERDFDSTALALRDLTAKAALIEDLKRRKSELEEQRDSEDPTLAAVAGSSYEAQIKQMDDKIQELESQYKEWRDNPKSLLDALADTLKSLQDIEIGKDADRAKERFKEAKTLRDVASYYFGTSSDIRQEAFDRATSEAEGDAKNLLLSFRPFLGTLQSLSNLIEKQAKDIVKGMPSRKKEDRDNKARTRIGYQIALSSAVQSAVDALMDDDTASFTGDNLAQKLRQAASGMERDIDPASEDYVFRQAMANEVRNLADNIQNLDTTYREHEELRRKAKERQKKAEERKRKKGEKRKSGSGASSANPSSSGGLSISIDTSGGIPVIEYDGSETPEENPESGNTEEKAPGSGTDISGEKGIVETKNEEKVSGETEGPETSKEDERKPETGEKGSVPDASGGQGSSALSRDEADLIEDITGTGDGGVSSEKIPGTVGERTGEPTTASFRGNAWHRYKTSDIKNGMATEEARSGSFYRQLIQKGFNEGFMRNHLLSELRSLFPDKRLPVEYMVMRAGKRGTTSGALAGGKASGAPYIFLVTPYTPKVAKIAPKTDSRIAGNIIVSNGREYLVVGNLGYSERQKGLAGQYRKLEDLLKGDAASRPDEEFVVHDSSKDGVSNFIYDQTPGYVVRRNAGDVSGRDVSLRELLANGNPHGLNISDFRWMILEGRTQGVSPNNMKFIGFRKGEVARRPAFAEHPGKIYLYIKAADGTYIPQYVSVVRYGDMSDANGKFWDAAQNLIRGIAEAKTPKARRLAVSKLRDMFVFSSRLGGSGTNIFFNEEENTITYSVGDLVKGGIGDTINFNTTSPEDALEVLTRMMREVNPRLAISARNLKNNAKDYIDAGLIQVNLKSLGLVDSQSYVYPVKTDNTPAVNFTPSQIEQAPRRKTTRSSPIYYKGTRYYTEISDGGITVTDQNGKVISDKDLLSELSDVRDIISGKIRATELTAVNRPEGRKHSYYVARMGKRDADTFVYVKTYNGGYERIQGLDLVTFRARQAYQKSYQRQQEAIQGQIDFLEDNDGVLPDNIPPLDLPETDDTEGHKEILPEDSTKESADTTDTKSVPVNDVIRDLVSDNPDLFDRLTALASSLLDAGYSSVDEIFEAMRKGRHSAMYSAASDEDSFMEYLDKIEECGF